MIIWRSQRICADAQQRSIYFCGVHDSRHGHGHGEVQPSLAVGCVPVVPLSTTGLPLVHSSKTVPGVHASQDIPRREHVSPADLTAVWGGHCPPQHSHSRSKGKRTDIAEWSSVLQLRANMRSFLLQLTGFRQETTLSCYRRKDRRWPPFAKNCIGLMLQRTNLLMEKIEAPDSSSSFSMVEHILA